MARYTHLKIYKDNFSLFLQFNKYLPTMSKKYKYTIGNEIQQLLLQNFRLIIQINRDSSSCVKQETIEKLIINIEELLILFRSLSFLRELSRNSYLEFSALGLEIVKQAEGWLKYLSKKNL
ncbi:MAG: four helix bundle protein [Candidatus Nanoarchaeia archaeon]